MGRRRHSQNVLESLHPGLHPCRKRRCEQKRSKPVLRPCREGRGLEGGRAPLRCSQPGSPATEGSVCQGPAVVQPCSPCLLYWGGRASGPAHVFLQHPCLGDGPHLFCSFFYSDECQKGTPPLHSTIVNKRLKMPEK